LESRTVARGTNKFPGGESVREWMNTLGADDEQRLSGPSGMGGPGSLGGPAGPRTRPGPLGAVRSPVPPPRGGIGALHSPQFETGAESLFSKLRAARAAAKAVL
jgi:hypothetical protein